MHDKDENLFYKMRIAEMDSWRAESDFIDSLTAEQKCLYYRYCEQNAFYLALKEKYENEQKKENG